MTHKINDFCWVIRCQCHYFSNTQNKSFVVDLYPEKSLIVGLATQELKNDIFHIFNISNPIWGLPAVIVTKFNIIVNLDLNGLSIWKIDCIIFLAHWK